VSEPPEMPLNSACLPKRNSEQHQLLGRFFLTECGLAEQ
jgi:hypothetical protein